MGKLESVIFICFVSLLQIFPHVLSLLKLLLAGQEIKITSDRIQDIFKNLT